MDDDSRRLLIIAESACKALGKLTAKERAKGPNPGWIGDYNELRKRVLAKIPRLEDDLPEVADSSDCYYSTGIEIPPVTTYTQLLAYHERIVAFLKIVQ